MWRPLIVEKLLLFAGHGSRDVPATVLPLHGIAS